MPPEADNSAQAADVPWLRSRHGKAGVAEFFQLAPGRPKAFWYKFYT